ncbi:TlpA family protein disulfide reductase [Paracoccaceae bacterium]|nr:TlpA family protein disulfide reductase [Paracoccaceae bacterium]
MKLPFRGVKNFLTLVVLYTAFSFCANTVLSGDNKFSVLEEFKAGEMKKLILHESPKAVSEEVFYNSSNDPISLKSFSGRLTLVNFWATWCAPCLEEMPSLSNLQKIKGSEKFNVVTIATMRNSPKSVENFFNKMSIDNLTKYQDPKGKLARSLKIAGLPLTLLLNKDNKEVARFIGDADWSSPNALKLIEKATEIDLKN